MATDGAPQPGSALGRFLEQGQTSRSNNSEIEESLVGDPADGRGRFRHLQDEVAIQHETLRNEARHIDPINIEDGVRRYEAETIERRLKLYKAAVSGDWKAAETIYNTHPQEVNESMTRRHETALHIATLAEQIKFVKNLVQRMSDKGIFVRDVEDNTAFCLAAITGKKELAQAMISRMKELEMTQNRQLDNLAMRRGRDDLLPLYLAAFSGRNKEMVKYLHEYTKNHQLHEDQDHQNLLVALINADMFDVALDVLTPGREYLATGQDRYGDTALDAMARKPHMLSKNYFPGFSDVQKRKARERLQRIWETMVLQGEEQIINVIGNNWRTIFVAVERGNLEFLRILIRSYPELVIKTNEEGRTIFHAAVVHRQVEIFSLIHEIGSFKKVVAECIDRSGNTMLHLAAELAPSSRLEITPGAALQLQLELLWFKEVKKVVGPRLAEARNLIRKSPKTPKELFIENHKDLIKKGEEWMRNTANSCILVAILVATVVFAAAYTLPGGNDQTTGYPMFLHEASFKIFAIADAISLISSASSVLTFLSILTSTYALEDFVRSLPRKLFIGLTTLFISIMAMLVAFGAAFFAYFKQRRLDLYYAVPVTVFAFIPVCLFINFHRHIFVNVIKSTFKCNSHFSPDGGDPLYPAAEVGTPGCFSCFKCCGLC